MNRVNDNVYNDIGFKTQESNHINLPKDLNRISSKSGHIIIFYIDIIIFKRFCLAKKSGKQNGVFILK